MKMKGGTVKSFGAEAFYMVFHTKYLFASCYHCFVWFFFFFFERRKKMLTISYFP